MSEPETFLRVEHIDGCVDFTFKPPIPLLKTTEMPLPMDEEAGDVLFGNMFIFYGNKAIRFKSEVFKSETEEQEYIERFARHIGRCLVIPDLQYAG